MTPSTPNPKALYSVNWYRLSPETRAKILALVAVDAAKVDTRTRPAVRREGGPS